MANSVHLLSAVILLSHLRHIWCSTTLTYSIDEELQIGTDVCDIRSDATWLADKHSPEVFNSLRFTILRLGTSTASSYFTVDEATGEIRIAEVIDRETLCPSAKTVTSCILRIDIAVHPAAYFEIIRAEVTVLDVNDNSPTFSSGNHQLTILESASIGSMFPLPAATDADTGENGKIEYRLLQNRDDDDELSGSFRLVVGRHRRSAADSDDVKLKLIRQLDREQRDRYQLIVLASDRGHGVQRTGTLTVDVFVGDVNDNAPRFERQSYEVSVAEDAPIGTTVVRMRATDPDVAENADIRFKFSTRSQTAYGNIFAIDPKFGDVILLQSLAYGPGDPVAVYQLSVIAEDGGPFPTPAHAALVVRVIDVNNHSPRIAVDTTVSAASDLPAAGGSATQPEIVENSPAGTLVAHVTATDADTGTNGIVHCEILPTTTSGGRLAPPDFRLDLVYEGEYQLLTAREFDREVSSRQFAAIRCSDSGVPPRSTVRNVTVLITDQNDNQPVFTSDVYEATIPENSPWGTIVTRVTASDPDVGENGRVTYLLDRRAESSATSAIRRFHIDPDTGVVTTLAGLDREAADIINVGVHASDAGGSGGRQLSRAIIRVHVTDVDDESPTFVRDDYSFTVGENMAVGTSVGYVSAVDLDSPPYNAFSYRLRDPELEPDSAYFRLDPETGFLTTATILDRERRSVYRFSVIAQSDTVRARADSTSITIRVSDANDNPPTFIFPNSVNNTVIVNVTSSLKMAAVASGGQISVAVCEAMDVDEGPNSKLLFDIVDQGAYHPGPFKIDRNTGRVTMMTEHIKVDSGSANTFALTVRVSDDGVPTLSRMETLHVTVFVNNDGRDYDYGWLSSYQSHDGSSKRAASVGDQIVNWLSGGGVLILGATLAGIATLIILLSIGLCVARSKRRLNGRSSSAASRHHLPMTKIELQRSAEATSGDTATACHPLLVGTDPDKLCNELTIQHFDSEPASPYGRMTSSSHEVTVKPASNEHDTDSGCADVSNSDDCGSSHGSNSSTEVCAVVSGSDPFASNGGDTSTVASRRPQSVNPRTSLLLQATQSDVDRSHQSLISSPSATLQLNAARKTVRFADDKPYPSTITRGSDLGLGHVSSDGAEYQPSVNFRSFSPSQRYAQQRGVGVTSFLANVDGRQSDSGSPV